MQFGQAFYGFFFSAEVALFGYLYAMIEEKEHYQKVTGYARAATLTGKFVSSCIAQILAMVFGSPPFNILVYLSIFGNCHLLLLLIVRTWKSTKFTQTMFDYKRNFKKNLFYSFDLNVDNDSQINFFSHYLRLHSAQTGSAFRLTHPFP